MERRGIAIDAVTGAVHLVVVGNGTAGITAAVDAARRGEHVLIVLDSDGAAARMVRATVRTAGRLLVRRVRVMSGAEVVCADGVGGVEAVVVRHRRSGRLQAFTAGALLIATR